MATDLYLINDLPKLRSLSISSPAVTESTATVSDLIDSPHGGAAGNEECKTPTSEAHRIPAISACPPPPRKQRSSVSCKRKLSELEFFEIVSSAEIEGFFNRCGGIPLPTAEIGDFFNRSGGILLPTAEVSSAAAPKKRRVFKRIVS